MLRPRATSRGQPGFEILEGFREATGGSVSVLGADPAHAPSHWRERIGIVLQESQAEPGLTVRECLEQAGPYFIGVVAALRLSRTDSIGKTVFLTTHYMEEAERLADRIAIIADGKIVAQGTPRTLGDRDRSAAVISFALPGGTGLDELPASLAERAKRQPDGRLVLESLPVAGALHDLSGWALEHGVELDDLEVRRPTLEDIYLEQTRHHS